MAIAPRMTRTEKELMNTSRVGSNQIMRKAHISTRPLTTCGVPVLSNVACYRRCPYWELPGKGVGGHDLLEMNQEARRAVRSLVGGKCGVEVVIAPRQTTGLRQLAGEEGSAGPREGPLFGFPRRK